MSSAGLALLATSLACLDPNALSTRCNDTHGCANGLVCVDER